MEHNIPLEREKSRFIVTVLGQDTKGIIAAIATTLAENGVNILDISQTILQEFFTMVMVIDAADAKVSAGDLRELLEKKGEQLGVKVTLQHEAVFDYMHRI